LLFFEDLQIAVLLSQSVNMFLFSWFQTIPLLITGAAIAGLAYSLLFSLMPSITADFFGVKNLGVNYGLVFTGWGIAGIIGPILGGIAVFKTGTYTMSYIVAGSLLLIGTMLVKFIKPPVASEI
jgi:OFA family oxalate/formate antiporter-like MFS transporter